MSLEYTTMSSAVGKDADAAALRESLMMSGIDWNLESSLNPGQPLPEITRLELNKDGGGGSTSSLLSGGVASPSRKTMKEYEQQQKSLEEENFSLKLRVYMLEERLFGKERPTGPEGADKTGEQLIELKVQLAALRDELAQKKSLLRAAAETLDKLERQNAADVEAERQRWEGSVADLQRQLEEAQSAAERAASAASDEPYLKAFEPLTADHAAPAADADQLASLEARMAELQAALVEMKETVGERDEEVVTLRRQLEEARSAATRTAQRADNTERQLTQARDQLTTREQLQLEQGRQLQLQLAESEAETQRLRQQLSEVEALPRVKELQRTCEQLTAGRAADGARLSELLTAQQKADDKLRASAANEALVKSAMKTLRTELEERKKQLTAARAELRRARERNLTLIDEMRDMHKLVESKFEQETPTSVASEGADTPAAESRPPTPHEVQVYLLRTETQRKDKKIRSLVAEMKEMNDMLMKYRWEVKEVAEEENERLWTELEENKKLIKELQDEKMELVLEKERQIQRLLGQLKDREPAGGGGGAAGTELQQQLELRDCHLAASSRELRQTRDQLGRLRANSERSAAELQEVQQQAQSVRSQLAHAALQVRERDALLAQLRDRLLQQRRLLDAPPEAPQLRQLAGALEQLCEELAAPRPGPPDADAVGGAGEMVAESSESTAARSEDGELGAEKTAALRAQLVDLREQLAVRERQLPELEEQAAAAEQLRSALEECQQQLRAADQRLSELAPLPDRLAEAQQQLTELAGLRNALAERERDLALAEGELNEVAELREQLTSRERQLAAAVGQRAELQQTRQLLAEREEEKASLLRHLDEQRRQHEREASALQERFEVTLTAPTWQQYRDAQQRHGQEEARLRRRLAESSGACQLLQQRLEELADFMELLLNLEERGVLDLSCLTAQHLQDLQRSLLQSRELSQSLTQSVLQHLDMEDAIEVSTASLADQSSLHIPPLGEKPATAGSENKASEEAPLNSTATSETVEVHKPTSGKGKTKKTKATKTKSADKKTAVSEKNKSSSLPPPAPKSKKPAKSSADTAGTAEPPASKAAAELPPAEPAPTPAASSRDSSAQASGAPVSESAVQAGCASVSEFGVQTSSAEVGDLGTRASDGGAEAGDTDAGEPAVLHLREQLEARSARLEALTAQLAGRDAQLVRQAALVEALQLQLQQAAGRTSTAELPLSVNAEAGGDSARLSVVREPLPGEVRDSFRWLVQRQRTSERSSGTDTPPPTQQQQQQQPTVERASGTDPPPPEEKDSGVDPHHQLSRTVERALSPILSVARAQSAELLLLHPAVPPPQVQQSRSAETLRSRTASSAAASDGSDTVQETKQRGGRSRPRPAQEPVRDAAAAAVPPVGDFSESEAWSEPDRDVSLARIGLDQSSLGTRTESWLGTHSESDSRHSRRRGRGGPQEVQELEAHIESLQQVKKALRAEVDIYQQVLPGDQHDKPADGKSQAGVMVPMEVLSEIHGLQQQLERAIAANERIRRQMQLTPRRAAEAPSQDLALALKITQEQLSEANERLEATQQRCDELRAKLNRAKENLRLAQLNAEQFKDKFVRVSDDMVHLRQRFNQMEADREQSEEARRRRHQQQESAAVRCLERELERARAASRDQEAEVQQLRQQLTAQPEPEAPSGGSDKENRSVTEHYPDSNVRASRSESQLVELNREKLRLLSARKQAESRGRLLRSESCLLDGEQRQAEQRRRLEAAKWAGWETERERLQTENGQLREERTRLRRQLVTSGADAGRAARRSLQAEAERARQAETRLAAEHAQCERRLSELSRVMSSDKERLGEVSAQLEEVNAEMETMRAKLNELDEAGQSCPESTRSCDLPAAPQIPLGEMTQPRSSVSDGHDANHESDRTSSYSSPDLGIESDCNRCLSRSSQTVRRTDDEPEPTPSETELLRQERDQMQTKLVATRTALQEALDKLTRADQRKARVERAIYRQLSKTHDILRRAKNNLAPPAAGAVPPPPDQ